MSATVTVRKWLMEFTGQVAHLGAACSIIATLHHHLSFHTALILTGIGVGLAAIKEFWYDYKYETAMERGSSLLDFSMYLVGMALGWFV